MKIPSLNEHQKKKLMALAEDVYEKTIINFDDRKNKIELINHKGDVFYRAHWFIFCTHKLLRDIYGEGELNYNETHENLCQEHKETFNKIMSNIETTHPVDILLEIHKQLNES